MDGEREERKMRVVTALRLLKAGWVTLDDGKGPGIVREGQTEEIPRTIWEEMKAKEEGDG